MFCLGAQSGTRLIGTVCLLAAGLQSVFAAESSDLLSTCSTLIERGQVLQAIQIQQEAIQSHPDDGRVRTIVSWCEWRQGNMIGALDQGQKAIELLPDEFLPAFNLARMQETLDACNDAIALYEKAQKLQPANPEPAVGIARCHLKLGNRERALEMLGDMMRAAPNQDFGWSLTLAKTYCRFDEASSASEAAAIALSKAHNQSELVEAKSILLLALLKANKQNEASKLFDDVFESCTSHDYELYVRAIADLVPVDQPEKGAKLVQAAVKNLGTNGETEGLFRTARICQSKAALTPNNNDWLRCAMKGYERAIELAPTESRLHLGLAAVLLALNEQPKALESLAKAQAIEPLNPWIPQVVSFAQRDIEASRLSHVSFRLGGLSCGCHASRIMSELNNIPGVKFSHIDQLNNFTGTLIIEETAVSHHEVWNKLRQLLAAGPKMETPIVFTIEDLQVKQMPNVESVVRVSQNATCGDPVKLYPSKSSIEPLKPTEYSHVMFAGQSATH